MFERRWALSVLDRVVEKSRGEFVQHGRPEHFERLKIYRLANPTCRIPHCPISAQRLLRSTEMRKRIDVPRVGFESMMRNVPAPHSRSSGAKAYPPIENVRLRDSKQE